MHPGHRMLWIVAVSFLPLGKATLRAVLGQHELDEMPGPKPGVSR